MFGVLDSERELMITLCNKNIDFVEQEGDLGHFIYPSTKIEWAAFIRNLRIVEG